MQPPSPPPQQLPTCESRKKAYLWNGRDRRVGTALSEASPAWLVPHVRAEEVVIQSLRAGGAGGAAALCQLLLLLPCCCCWCHGPSSKATASARPAAKTSLRGLGRPKGLPGCLRVSWQCEGVPAGQARGGYRPSWQRGLGLV